MKLQGAKEGKREVQGESGGCKLEGIMGECVRGRQEGNIEGNGFCLRPVETSSELLVPDNVQYRECCDSGLELPEINYEI